MPYQTKMSPLVVDINQQYAQVNGLNYPPCTQQMINAIVQWVNTHSVYKLNSITSAVTSENADIVAVELIFNFIRPDGSEETEKTSFSFAKAKGEKGEKGEQGETGLSALTCFATVELNREPTLTDVYGLQKTDFNRNPVIDDIFVANSVYNGTVYLCTYKVFSINIDTVGVRIAGYTPKLNGEKGDKGDTGATGAAGATGATGARGASIINVSTISHVDNGNGYTTTVVRPSTEDGTLPDFTVYAKNGSSTNLYLHSIMISGAESVTGGSALITAIIIDNNSSMYNKTTFLEKINAETFPEIYMASGMVSGLGTIIALLTKNTSGFEFRVCDIATKNFAAGLILIDGVDLEFTDTVISL